jgi:hypothetical protein
VRVDPLGNGWSRIFVDDIPVVKAKRPRTIQQWLSRLNAMDNPRAYALQRRESQKKRRQIDGWVGEVQAALKSEGLAYRYRASWTSRSIYLYVPLTPQQTMKVRVSDHPPCAAQLEEWPGMVCVHPGGLTPHEAIQAIRGVASSAEGVLGS